MQKQTHETSSLNVKTLLRTAHISVQTTVKHNTAQNSSDNLPSNHLDNNHDSNIVFNNSLGDFRIHKMLY